jgi:hypothetical protein
VVTVHGRFCASEEVFLANQAGQSDTVVPILVNFSQELTVRLPRVGIEQPI